MSRHWLFAVVWLLVTGHWSFAAEISKPLSPAESQKAFVLADSNLSIELAAAEPDVIDPVAIRFDEDGRMWVVEMRDYPLGNPDKSGEPLSRIHVLEDKDGDGRFESATTFAEKLLFVTGLQPWKGGVFVTLSGRLAYMKDTDGDGKCDLDETWFEGFAELNTQLRANHPRLALDNWIYVANGLRGGKVVNKKLGEKEPINISGMDFRFHPLTGACEAVTGNGQFGLCFDDWGNRFNCSNRNPVRHVVIEDRYLKANPAVTVSATVNDVANFGEKSRIFPISRAWTTSNLHAGQFTAACGVYIYRGDLLPAEFKGNAFTCDPTGNLIHREIMQPAGPTFTSKAAYDGKEFLASPDEWFRPVNMELGPDGALYVVDMYRCVIEHPDFVPDELKRRPDLRLGDDRGRIWRIAPANTNPTRKRGTDGPPLSKLASDQLIPFLADPNAWQRETAQRLFLERSAASYANELRDVVRKSDSNLARSHALWVLVGGEALERGEARIALRDSDPHVRRQALLASEVSGRAKAMASVISDLTRDSSPLVRFQSRLTARTIGASQLLEPKQLMADANNAWMRRAIELSVEPRTASAILAKVWFDTNDSRDVSAGELALIEDLAEMAAAVDVQRLGAGIGVSELSEKDNVDVGLAALRGASKVWARKNVPDSLRPTLVPPDRLLEIANDKNSDPKDRAAAVSLLAFAPDSSQILLSFAEKTRDQSIRIAAIGALARQKGTDAWQSLLDQFASDTPPIRRAILDGLLSNSDRTKLLLDAIEGGRVKTSEIDQLQVKRLTENRDAAIKDRATKLFAAAMPADRAKALADYQPVLQMKGDPAKGQAIFEKNCAACHRINGIGVNVAPDISDSRAKKYEQILADILQPNRAIDNNYVGYTVRQLDGTILTGILAAETATSITLKQQGGKEAVIPRSEIDELKSSGQSLMPEGLERQIPPEGMADLLAFIKNWRYLDGRTPLSDSGN
ncbi:MAG TPA: PVC-type heme-binding CxxCH protein [Pirellulaceae bacterium]|jgi:putative membrane-bound dehydrogenase-like protein